MMVVSYVPTGPYALLKLILEKEYVMSTYEIMTKCNGGKDLRPTKSVMNSYLKSRDSWNKPIYVVNKSNGSIGERTLLRNMSHEYFNWITPTGKINTLEVKKYNGFCGKCDGHSFLFSRLELAEEYSAYLKGEKVAAKEVEEEWI